MGLEHIGGPFEHHLGKNLGCECGLANCLQVLIQLPLADLLSTRTIVSCALVASTQDARGNFIPPMVRSM